MSASSKTSAPLQFVESARRVLIVTQAPIAAPLNTFLRYCEECAELIPHVRAENYVECVHCRLRSFRDGR